MCNNKAGTCTCSAGYAGEDCSLTKPRFCSDNCASTCVSLCVLNSAITADPNAKIDAGEFGNNVHCLESCNGRCFVDCMAGAKPTAQSNDAASVAKGAHAGEDTDIQPAQIARSANGDKKVNMTALEAFAPKEGLGPGGSLKFPASGVSNKFSAQSSADISAVKDAQVANAAKHSQPGRPFPSDMVGDAPPASVEQ